MTIPSDTRAWLERPELARLWDALHSRLERNGLSAQGQLRLRGLDEREREALGLLLGRPRLPPEARVGLADLDQSLRSSAAGSGLVAVLTALRGPLTDRRAVRRAQHTAQENLWSTVEEALHEAGLDGRDWTQNWLDDIRRSGALSRLEPAGAAPLLRQAAEVLGRLLAEPMPAEPITEPIPYGRGDLAERVTGTAHGLDDDTLLSRLVLRALARALELPPPKDARSRRELWAAVGVTTDTVSGTVLTYGLRPLGGDWRAGQLRERAEHGAETHLTVRDIRRTPWQLPPGTEVFVCENPRVVEAAADAGCARAMVCTSGNPTTAVLTLLDAVRSAGATLAYRGDFDWPGIAIANRLITRYQARPWRMTAAEYESQVAQGRERGTPQRPLAGRPVEAAWDPELRGAMVALGVSVEEESALERLVADLTDR